MPAQQIRKSGGARKIGRNKEKCARYFAHGIRARNKLKKILKSNGLAAADSWKRDSSKPFPRETSLFGLSR